MRLAAARLTIYLAVVCAVAAATAAASQTPDDPCPDSAAPAAESRTQSSEPAAQQGTSQGSPAPDPAPGAPETGTRQRDLLDVAQRLFRFKKKPGDAKPKPLEMLILPVLDSNPTNGFVTGIEATG